MNNKKRLLEVAFFLLIMGLTFYTVLHGQDLSAIYLALHGMRIRYLFLALLLGIAFICLEGIMIWRLLSSMGGSSGPLRCIEYSFIGFFYSGITPSATGGQPMQLYYMNRDKNRPSDSTVVLMTVAVFYKLVLVFFGLLIFAFWNQPLRQYLGNYYYLFLLGIGLNTMLVILILGVMLFPNTMLFTASGFERLMIHIGLWKTSRKRRLAVENFIKDYGQAVDYLKTHKEKLIEIFALTCVQRSTLFVLTWMVYLGFRLNGTDGLSIILLQASVYIAVDMLPVPGAQGITELMYKSVFATVFPGTCLIPSMLVSRGINFYFLLLVSMGISMYAMLKKRFIKP